MIRTEAYISLQVDRKRFESRYAEAAVQKCSLIALRLSLLPLPRPASGFQAHAESGSDPQHLQSFRTKTHHIPRFHGYQTAINDRHQSPTSLRQSLESGAAPWSKKQGSILTSKCCELVTTVTRRCSLGSSAQPTV